MAFDLLAAPASSSADERQFSQAHWTLNKERFNTKDDLAEANQCLKSWINEGIIYQTKPEDQLSDSDGGTDDSIATTMSPRASP
jgi:hypothetical protein